MAAQYDEVFTTHLKVQHRTFINHNLIFKLSQLDQNSLEKIIGFASDTIGCDQIDAKEEDITVTEEFYPKLKTTMKDPLEDLLKNQIAQIVGPLSNEDFVTPTTNDKHNITKNELKEEEDIEKDRKSVKTEDLVIDVKQEEYEDEKIKFQYNIKEREWCVRMFKRCRNSPEWYKAFQYEFKKQFHHRAKAPDRKSIKRMAKKKEKYNSLEHGNRGKERHAKNKLNICDICGFIAEGSKKYEAGRKLARHKRFKHSASQTCDQCDRIVPGHRISFHKLGHLPDSEKPFKCSICGKGFTSKSRVKDHELIHSDERPFACKYECGFACKTQNNIPKHEQVCAKKQEQKI